MHLGGGGTPKVSGGAKKRDRKKTEDGEMAVDLTNRIKYM